MDSGFVDYAFLCLLIGVKTRYLPLAIELSICYSAAGLLSKFNSEGVSILLLLPEVSPSSVLECCEELKSMSCLLTSSLGSCSVNLGMNLRYFYCLDIELLAKVSAMVLL